MLTSEQVEKLNSEKEILLSAIQPAMDEFYKKIGYIPDINMVIVEHQTKCGILTKSRVEVSIRL